MSVDVKSYDIVGDVHGCFDELLELLFRLGYTLCISWAHDGTISNLAIDSPPNRMLVFVGDLVDRGPRSDKVLELVNCLVSRGMAVAVSGNHDNKLMRYLKGNPVRVDPELQHTVDKLKAHGNQFVARVYAFLFSLPLIYESDHLIVVHAACRAGVSRKVAHGLALYGETNGRLDANGYPVRLTRWEDEYGGAKTIVHGHTATPEPTVKVLTSGGRIVNVDTGAPTGGKLTALRFPELEFISVPARATYAEPVD